MRATCSLIRREFAAYFTGPIGYVALFGFLVLNGLLFWLVVGLLTEKGPRNLHVWFSILITPTERRVNDRELAEVSGVLRRTEGRIAAGVTADLTGRTSLATTGLGKAREELAGLAQETLDQAIARWRLRESFRFEAVITSIYFTDGKVKVELALARGKQAHDKRQDIARRDAQREVIRELGRRAKGKI